MKKKKTTVRKGYLQPSISVLGIDAESHLLAGSPAVQPGGGGGGTIQVIDPTEDNEDNELEG